MKCEMCGSEQEVLYRTDVEGAEMTVCKECSGYGEVLEKVKEKKPEPEKKEKTRVKKKAPDRNKIITLVKKDYPKIIKDKRERKGLTQEEMAKRIGEKESVLHHLETGKMEPSIDLARKIERFLNVKLIIEYEEKAEVKKGSKDSGMTIGDMLSLE